MRFAVVLPWWGYALAFGAAVILGWLAYARVPVKLPLGKRLGLSALRAVTLLLLIAILLRPVITVPSAAANNSLLPILVDVSRSMRLRDPSTSLGASADGPSRLERAQAMVKDLQAQLGKEYRLEILTFGETLAVTTDIDRVAATARRSDLSGAIADLAERHRNDRLAGVVVLSDGGDTAPMESGEGGAIDAPIFTVGIGNASAPRDREVVNLTAGEPLLPGASIDVSVSATSTGFGTEPVELRVSANGRPVEVRRLTPSTDGAPVHAVFTVSPEPDAPTVYTVQIPQATGEVAIENNSRSVLVPPQTGKRRLLVVEGAPGFEHTFLKRALSDDPGLEIDAVVRKGQNDDGRDTFYVQADPSRMAALSSGYPFKRSELFAYDGVIFGNIEADFFTKEQLELTNDFIAQRGGGLLVLGARSFDRQGLAGTALEQALPIDLTDRGSTITLGASPDHRAQHARAHRRWRVASGDAAGRHAGRESPEVGIAAGARVGRARRRIAARRADPCGRVDGRRDTAAADRGAALRPGTLGGVCRRSVVAMADAAAGHRYELRNDLAAARALGHCRRARTGDDRRDEPGRARHHRSHQRRRPRRGLQAGGECRGRDRVDRAQRREAADAGGAVDPPGRAI